MRKNTTTIACKALPHHDAWAGWTSEDTDEDDTSFEDAPSTRVDLGPSQKRSEDAAEESFDRMAAWAFPGLPPAKQRAAWDEACLPVHCLADFCHVLSKVVVELAATDARLASHSVDAACGLVHAAPEAGRHWQEMVASIATASDRAQQLRRYYEPYYAHRRKQATAGGGASLQLRYTVLLVRLSRLGFTLEEQAEVVFACRGGYRTRGPGRQAHRRASIKLVKDHQQARARRAQTAT